MNKYNPQIIEKKWQKIWKNEKTFKSTINNKKQKYYILEMFPYPSGDIHMGHVRNYTLGDLIARYKNSKGFNVLHPMGWDSFGLPAENAAIENKIHPQLWTRNNISNMKTQLKKMGLSYDWERELSTCEPEYYKHEQKMFLDFYKNNIAYRKETWVNWDPVEQTVLANEQVIDGKGWRSGAEIEKRKMKGWFLRITNFADDLLKEIENLTEWPEKVKTMQKNWIGKSSGCKINFNINELKDVITVFSTRPDTLFGASFIAVSPKHPFAIRVTNENKRIKKLVNTKSFENLSETDIDKNEKIGIKTQYTTDHPFLKNKKLPIYIANFVLIDYGTGAIFGCPAHDQRDLEFALKYKLDVLPVVSKSSKNILQIKDRAYTENGIMVNSEFLNGLVVKDAIEESIKKLVALKSGERTINFRLRDWGVSRQRYWGCPIPIIYCKKCGEVPVPEKDLPVVLPKKVSFNTSGNPLQNHKEWRNVCCPKCDSIACRETDTFDTFFESSWYFARFANLDPKTAIPRSSAKYWLPVDQYIGGVEHAVLHLLYSRFFTKVLKSLNKIHINEPFKMLKTQGMVCHKTFQNSNGQWLYPKDVYKENEKYFNVRTKEPVIAGRTEKMSKSKKNVIDPNIIIENYGADTARFFILSDSPPDRDMEWTEAGVDGAWRFLNKLWKIINDTNFKEIKAKFTTPTNIKDKNLVKITHKMIFEVTKSIENFHFNIAIASIRTLFNEISIYKVENEKCLSLKKYSLSQLINLISPICPHFAEESWEVLGNKTKLYNEPWPVFDKKYLTESKVNIPIQINGKKRDEILVDANISEKEIKKIIFSQNKIKKFITNEPKKIIFIPKRIVNIVL